MEDTLVYLDISIGEDRIGRIVCQLFDEKAPKAVKNFISLCTGDVTVDGVGELTLKGNIYHRIIRNFMIQCGDIIYGNGKFEKSSQIGTGGCSIYATEQELGSDENQLKCYGLFEDENMGEFTEPFLLAMANTGNPNSNSSQFFITVAPQPHLNGKHTIFGKVLYGKHVVRTIENSPVDSDGFPSSCVKIDDCGIWNDSMDVPLYNACNNTIGGDIYEEDPNDDINFDPEDSSKAYEATNTIKESGTLLFKQKDYQNALLKYKKSLKYVNEFIPEMEVNKDNCILFTVLKMKLYLNISLVYFNLKDNDNCITYTTYLLDMENVPDLDQAKAYYRRGNAYFAKKRLEEALNDYKNCQLKNPSDKVINDKIDLVESQIEAQKEKTKKNIAKFFS
ncbi:hypothetical protein Kpol_1067p25 [Vanderwaltozyma polyspora DSM 70294]|uniref:peptidylprolyl isomerase n=1 Tax=Vanderwaltozyma polyspora (strain ATCC 22028 / DSM 70294 / BCRC 21397 / CBS 2163 / NBRC 10782 / NRRL Y-8283 / UCD 57-17) TaxID=436907 RepID=A7TNW9_VANPO|nr:uncharacterized protein Kpol_1067p25 [Vanderwaltozyma polyspora DSM 70294]EDO16052.1 hypothetical protein Kpol_1067p25 [Vanderwaltozyma polyspora DSM 70294]